MKFGIGFGLFVGSDKGGHLTHEYDLVALHVLLKRAALVLGEVRHCDFWAGSAQGAQIR